MSEIPIHIKKLAENNRNIVESLGRIDETSKSANLTMKIASLVSSFAIGDAYLRGIISENESSLNLPIDPEFDQFFEDNQNIGMLLVRPEMYGVSAKIEDFLNQQNLKVLYTSDLQVSNSQYLSICRESALLESAKYAMPTRAMVYTGGSSRLLIVREDNPRIGGSLADRIVRELKGTGGVYQKGTIRGEIVFNEAQKLGFGTLIDPDISDAIDPLRVLKLLPEFPQFLTPLARSIESTDEKRLSYNAVAVHIPDSKEISRDLYTLVGENSIKDFKEMLK